MNFILSWLVGRGQYWWGGGDFNLRIFPSDKSNGRINQKFADGFND
jgi:hypothetical protein